MEDNPMDISLLIDERVSLDEPLPMEFFETITEAVFTKVGLEADEIELSLVLTDDEDITEVNMEWRGMNDATDVLSFPMSGEMDGPGLPLADSMLGDIVISLDTAARQAEDDDIPLHRQIAFLFIHGVLHLIGYDHERSTEEEDEMFTLQ